MKRKILLAASAMAFTVGSLVSFTNVTAGSNSTQTLEYCAPDCCNDSEDCEPSCCNDTEMCCE